MSTQRGLSIESIATDPARMRARCEALVAAMVGQDLADKWWLAQTRHLVVTLQNRFIVWHPVLCMLI